MTYLINVAFWAFLIGLITGGLGRYVWDNRARIMEALRGEG